MSGAKLGALAVSVIVALSAQKIQGEPMKPQLPPPQSSQPPRSVTIERVSEYCFLVASLMRSFEADEMRRYTIYMDKALIDEARFLLAQIYGYATNETEAIEWEAFTKRYLQLYVLHVSIAQMQAYYEYYEVENPRKHSNLQESCFKQVSVQLLRYLEENLQYPLAEPLLQYQLMRFINLPVFVAELNDAPYLKICLRTNRLKKRFKFILPKTLTLNASPTNTSEENLFAIQYPLPFEPDKNFASELELFRRAQTSVLIMWNSLSPTTTSLSRYVDADILDYADEFIKNYFATHRNDSMPYVANMCVRKYALILFFADFLQSERNRLVCHPLFHELKDKSVLRLNAFIKYFRRWSYDVISERNCSAIMRISLRSLYEAILRLKPIVGYTLQGDPNIAMILVRPDSLKNVPH